MTVIAWDGRTVAADRMATNSGVISSVTKLIVRSPNVYGLAGMLAQCLALTNWHSEGADPAKWPAFQATDKWSRFMVFKTFEVVEYEHVCLPIPVEDKFAAWGQGRELALGAMAAGATVIEAVRIACRFADGCGVGINYVDLTKPLELRSADL